MRKLITFQRLAAVVLCLSMTSIASVSQARGHGWHGWSETARACFFAPVTKFDGTITDAAIATPDLSTLVTAVAAADLAGALSEGKNLTVFAPTNKAFKAIPEPLLNSILADKSLLTSILTYHVVPRHITPRWAFYRANVETLNGQRLFLSFDRKAGAKVNNSVINCRGVRTDNGLVWIIDSVLLPQFRHD